MNRLVCKLPGRGIYSRQPMRIHPSAWLIFILFLCLAVASCGDKEQTQARQAPPVTVALPTVRTIQEYTIFTGSSRAVESAEIVARVPGVLETVEFEPSARIQAGDLLFTIEKTKYMVARDAAEAAVRSSEAELLRADTELRRVEKASRSKAVSEMDVDRAKAARDMAKAGVMSAKASLADAELTLSYTDVRSPIAGVVGRNLVDAGNLVGQGGPTLLTTVNKLQPMYVYFHVPESLVLKYLDSRRKNADVAPESATDEEGGRAFVQLANETGFPHQGVIDFINNTVDPNTGTIELRVRLSNEELFLFPGLFVRVKVVGREIPDAVLIAETAIGSDLGGKYVLIVGEGNLVEQRYVQLGKVQSDGLMHITAGLAVADTVIVNGLMFARPGLPVTPLTAEQFKAMRQQAAQ